MSLKSWLGFSVPTVNYFKLNKNVLAKTIAGIAQNRQISKGDVRKAMVEHLRCFQGQYYSGKKPDNPYHDPLCRAAYLYCYVPANANLFEIAIKRSPDIVDLISQKVEDDGAIKICAFDDRNCMHLDHHLAGVDLVRGEASS